MPVTAVDDNDERSREIDDDGYDINQVWIHSTRDIQLEETDPFSKDFVFAKSLEGVHADKKRSIAVMAKNRMAKLEKAHESADGKVRSKKLEEQIVTGYNAFEVVAPPYNMDNLAKLYEVSTPHKAAVDAKVSNIVGLGYDFIPNARTKAKMDNFDKQKSEKFQKKLNNWKIILDESINDMNSEDSLTEILEKVWTDLETMGNGYLEIGRSDTTGEIGYIGHLPAATVRVRRKRDGFVQIIANKAVFFRNFGKKDADPIGKDSNPNEVIHFKNYTPTNNFYGIPDVIAAKEAIAGNKFSSEFNLDYFENKAVPRHLIILKGATINPRLAKNISEFFETGLKGINHRSLFVPLPGDTQDKKVEFKIEPVESGVQDSSFINYRKENRSEILMSHRVPINKVGLPEGVSLAVARDADKTFKEQVTNPRQDKLEHKVNKVIRDIQGDQVLFDFSLNELSLTDEDTQSKIDERRIKTGTQTQNEQRVKRGEPALPGGDKLLDLSQKGKEVANEARAQGNRERDAQRSAGATDSAGEGRNAQGEGRTNSAG